MNYAIRIEFQIPEDKWYNIQNRYDGRHLRFIVGRSNEAYAVGNLMILSADRKDSTVQIDGWYLGDLQYEGERGFLGFGPHPEKLGEARITAVGPKIESLLAWRSFTEKQL